MKRIAGEPFADTFSINVSINKYQQLSWYFEKRFFAMLIKMFLYLIFQNVFATATEQKKKMFSIFPH